jgi:hypothetical protein
MNPEVIRAFTPVFLATVGGALGLAVIFAPTLEDDQRASGIGLAGTAIAGAAGLAQNTKNEAHINGQNAELRVDNTKQPTHENVAG